MEEKKSRKRKAAECKEEKFLPDTIVVEDTSSYNHENNEMVKNENNTTDYEELIEYLRNENDEFVDILNERSKSKQHPYKFILDTFQIAEHQKKITDNPDFISYYDTPLIEITTKEELDILIENLSNLKEIGVHCGNCENFYNIKVGVLILRTVDKCYLVDLTELRNSATLLTQVFINPNIVKIFYDSDLIMKHLQQDLSLYFVNIFDIHLARNILQIEELQLREFLEQNYETYGKIPRDPMIYVKRPLPDFVKNYCKYLVNYHIHAYRNLKNQLITNDKNIYFHILDECNNKCKIVYQQSDKTEILQIAHEIKSFQSYQWKLLPKLYKLRDQLAKSNDKNPKQIIDSKCLIDLIIKNPVGKKDLAALTDSVYVHQNIDQIFEVYQQLQQEMQINIENTPRKRRNLYKDDASWSETAPDAAAAATSANPELLNSVNESLRRVAVGLSTLMQTNKQTQNANTSQQQQQQAAYAGSSRQHQEVEQQQQDDGSTWEINRQGDEYYEQNQESYQYRGNKHKKIRKGDGKIRRGGGYNRHGDRNRNRRH